MPSKLNEFEGQFGCHFIFEVFEDEKGSISRLEPFYSKYPEGTYWDAMVAAEIAAEEHTKITGIKTVIMAACTVFSPPKPQPVPPVTKTELPISNDVKNKKVRTY